MIQLDSQRLGYREVLQSFGITELLKKVAKLSVHLFNRVGSTP